jgi:hypothetical protein
MIPVTSKAFVVGSLLPDRDLTGEEQVMVRDGTSAEPNPMSRTDLCRILESQKAKKKARKKVTKKEPASGFSKENSNVNDTAAAGNNKQKKSTKKNGPTGGEIASRSPQSESSEPALPYFEIKEEIDGAGKIVRSEAVNVTKQLELVSKQAEDSKEDSKEFMDTEEEDDEFQMEAIAVTEDSKRPPVSDEEYRALSARLDELARLEEEAEGKMRENQKSARKLQSKGWSKGFLGGTPKSDVAPAPKEIRKKTTTQQHASAPPRLEQPFKKEVLVEKTPPSPIKPKESTTSASGWSKGFLNTTTPSKKVELEVKERQDNVPAGSKKVSFQHTAAEVREIPRIGEKSVASLKKPPSAGSGLLPANDSNTSGAARPFDTSVFSGVVKERPIGKSSSSTQRSSSTAETQPKKKLSKFAQERMQGFR